MIHPDNVERRGTAGWPVSPNAPDHRARSARVPASFALFGLVCLPVALLVGLLSTGPDNARLAVGGLAAPLLIAVCAYPHVAHSPGAGILFRLLTLVYAIEFGVRGLFLAILPKSTTFPNLTLPQDFPHVAHGLLWAALGIYVMELAYFALLRRPARDGASATRGGLAVVLQRTPAVPFFLVLCALGIVGEVHSIRSGAALYIYNSPAFAAHTGVAATSSSGLFSVLGDLYVFGMVGLMAHGIAHRKRSVVGLATVLWISQGLYYSYGLYKYGLIGLGILLVLVLGVQGRRRALRIVIPLMVALIFLVFPVINLARANLLALNESGKSPSSQWLGIFSDSAHTAIGGQGESFTTHYLLPVVQRFNGAEALGVADKYQPVYGPQGWGTYVNTASFLLPSFARPYQHATYFPWETKYVGESLTGYNVVPVPALVESYVSLGIPGLILVMALIGLAAAALERFGSRHQVTALGVALFGYIGWRLLDIETNLFVIVLPIVKVSLTVLALAWLFALVPDPLRARLHGRSPGEERPVLPPLPGR